MISVPDLLLDPSIKFWVLLPISAVMVLVGVLRTFITLLLEPSPKLQNHKLVREQQHLTRLRNWCNNRYVLLYQGEYEDKCHNFMVDYSSNKYLAKPPSPNPEQPQNPLGDPGSNDFLMQSAKSSIANWLPQTAIMWWVNYFFKGYVIMRLPFDVTANFKSMLQQSINTPDLDASYVSSVSWYFVNLMGLRSVYSLLFNDDGLVNKLMSQQNQQPIQPQLAGAGPTAQKQFQGALESLRIAPFESCVISAPDRLVEKYGS